MARATSAVIGEGGRRIIFSRVFDFLLGPEGTGGVDFVVVKYNSSSARSCVDDRKAAPPPVKSARTNRRECILFAIFQKTRYRYA